MKLSMRPEWPPRAKPAAIALLAFAGAVLIARLTITNTELDLWVPAVVVGLLTVAATVTLVDGILRREANERVHARVEYVQQTIRFAYSTFAEIVAIEYNRPPRNGRQPVPADIVGFLDLWLALDVKPTPWMDTNQVPMNLRLARELHDQLQRHRLGDREVLTAELVTAIDRFSDSLMTAEMLFEVSRAERATDAADTIRRCREHVIRGAREFGEVLGRDGRGRVVFTEAELTALNSG